MEPAAAAERHWGYWPQRTNGATMAAISRLGEGGALGGVEEKETAAATKRCHPTSASWTTTGGIFAPLVTDG